MRIRTTAAFTKAPFRTTATNDERIESFFGRPRVITDDCDKIVKHDDLLHTGNLFWLTLPPSTGHWARVANFTLGDIASIPFLTLANSRC